MAPPLHATVELRLDQTLSQFRQWQTPAPLESEPELLRELTGGLSNHSFLVSAGQLYVVRLEGQHSELHPINRQAELRAISQASEAGIAPVPRYFNPDLGALVTDYLDTVSIEEFDAEATAELLRRIHSLPPMRSRQDLEKRIDWYLRLAAQKSRPVPRPLSNCEAAVRHCLTEVAALESNPVLCHNDLLRANRVFSGGSWYALDWEYAAMGNRWFDLAAICWEEQLSASATSKFAAHYLQREADETELCQLRCLHLVYGYLECLWHLAVTGEAEGSKLEQLERASAGV